MICKCCRYEFNGEMAGQACPNCNAARGATSVRHGDAQRTISAAAPRGQLICIPPHRLGSVSLTKKPDVFRTPWLLVAFLLDASGSMEGKKLASATQGLTGMVTSLEPLGEKCRLGVVKFNHEADVLHELSSPAMLGEKIYAGDAEGGTNLGGALRCGGQLLARCRVEGPSSKVAVLMSDGEDSGFSSPVEEASRLKADGVLVVTVAFGKDADHQALEAIASSPELCFTKATGRELESFLKNLGATLTASVQAGEDLSRTLPRIQ